MQEILIPHANIFDCSQLLAPSPIPSTRLSHQFIDLNLYSFFISGPVLSCHIQQVLSFSTQSECSRFSSYQDHYQGISFLFGRFMAKRGIAQHCGLQFSDILIDQYGQYGKPISSDAFFNITRSGPYIVCAVSSTHDVGVDIEIINTDVEILGIKQYLCGYYPDFARSLPDVCSSHLSFYSNWTRFEAQTKLAGTGLSSNCPLLACSSDFLLKFENLELTGHLSVQLTT